MHLRKASVFDKERIRNTKAVNASINIDLHDILKCDSDLLLWLDTSDRQLQQVITLLNLFDHDSSVASCNSILIFLSGLLFSLYLTHYLFIVS